MTIRSHILVRCVKKKLGNTVQSNDLFSTFFFRTLPAQAAQTKHVNRYNVNQITVNLYEVYKTPYKLIS